MKIIDPGHKYELLSLDGKLKQTLQFVKRDDNPEKYPINRGHYPGTTMQDVIHCLLNRIRYLRNQQGCVENEMIQSKLQECIWLLELRAAKRHGRNLHITSLEGMEMCMLCPKCGHIQCDCKL